jgi:DNA-binding NtrC family response regulator
MITPRQLSLSRKSKSALQDAAAEDHQRDLPTIVATFEKQRILKALEDAKWVKAKAARILGIPEATLRSKLKKHGLERVGASR